MFLLAEYQRGIGSVDSLCSVSAESHISVVANSSRPEVVAVVIRSWENIGTRFMSKENFKARFMSKEQVKARFMSK